MAVRIENRERQEWYIMKFVSIKCPHCGAKLTTTQNSKMVTCEYCNQDFMIDNEVKAVQFMNAEQAGYEFELGRQRAKEEKKKRAIEEATLEVGCPKCGKMVNVPARTTKRIICECCGCEYDFKLGFRIHMAIDSESSKIYRTAINYYYLAYELDNSSPIARDGFKRMREELKDSNFYIFEIPHFFSQDEFLLFKIDFMEHIKGKKRQYYYNKMNNISCDERKFWFEYPNEGRLKFEVKKPDEVTKFLLNAKEGCYPDFKDIN